MAPQVKPIIEHDLYKFRDLNSNGQIDPYEDYRIPLHERVDDLLSRMTLEEKAGMMLIQTLNATVGGNLPEKALRFAKMTT